eukprot:1639723-Rhodomonas_salina.2
MRRFGNRASAKMVLRLAMWVVILAVAGGVEGDVRDHLGSKAPYDPPQAESCHVEPPQVSSPICTCIHWTITSSYTTHHTRDAVRYLRQVCFGTGVEIQVSCSVCLCNCYGMPRFSDRGMLPGKREIKACKVLEEKLQAVGKPLVFAEALDAQN